MAIVFDEVMIMKIGFLGMSDEAIINVPVVIDDDLSVEENQIVLTERWAEASVEALKLFRRPFAGFIAHRLAEEAEEETGEKATPEDIEALTDMVLEHIQHAEDHPEEFNDPD